jgi:hypothetical protein
LRKRFFSLNALRAICVGDHSVFAGTNGEIMGSEGNYRGKSLINDDFGWILEYG